MCQIMYDMAFLIKNVNFLSYVKVCLESEKYFRILRKFREINQKFAKILRINDSIFVKFRVSSK